MFTFNPLQVSLWGHSEPEEEKAMGRGDMCAMKGIWPQINVIYQVGHFFLLFICAVDNPPPDLHLNAANDWTKDQVIV